MRRIAALQGVCVTRATRSAVNFHDPRGRYTVVGGRVEQGPNGRCASPERALMSPIVPPVARDEEVHLRLYLKQRSLQERQAL